MDITDPTVPTWGYKPDGEAQIFDLVAGTSLPDGWSASPTVITDPVFATAEALTARAAGRVYVPPVVNAVDVIPAAASPDTAIDEIARLKGIIADGMAENERLATAIDGAEEELAAAAADILTLRNALAEAGTAKDEALARIDLLSKEVAQAKADLDAATAPKAADAAKPAAKAR